MSGMQMDAGDLRLLPPVTERTIGCALRVAHALGHRFAAKVTQMRVEIRRITAQA
jgi:hypothetical protein